MKLNYYNQIIVLPRKYIKLAYLQARNWLKLSSYNYIYLVVLCIYSYI